MKGKSNTPAIRFKGFNDDWEQRKLGECAGFRRGSFPQPYGNKEWYDGEGAMPFVQVADVADDMKLVDDTKQKISKLAQPMSVYADKGSVLVTLQGSIGRVAITQYGAFVDRTVLIFDKYNQDIDKTFWAYIIKEKFIDEARKAPGGTIKTITKEALSDFDLMLPNYDEQKKLGAFLVSIDNLITLHQRKLEKLQNIKKSMLEKMFPQNGSNVPEIRFKGFTDAWEQRKVGDFMSESRELGHKGDIAHKMTVKLWGKGVYEKNDTGSANTQYFTRHAGQFIYSKLDFLNCAFGVVPDELESLETTADVPAFDCDGVNPYFMFYMAIQPSFYEKNGMLADGSRKAKRIHANTFLNMPFMVPTLEEQNKIVNLLNVLDDLITLHQRKLEKLQNIKKSMLEKMFV